MSAGSRPSEPGGRTSPGAADAAAHAAAGASESHDSPDPQDPHGRLFLDYWAIKCREGRLPRRQDIDPLEMRSFLPYVVLLDVERQPGGLGLRFRYRLVGTHVVEIFGRELTGVHLDEVNFPDIYPAVHDQLARVVQTCRPAIGCYVTPTTHRQFPRYEHVTVPMASDGFAVDMLLGVRCGLPGPRQRTEQSLLSRAYL
jgi:hypothetical protein